MIRISAPVSFVCRNHQAVLEWCFLRSNMTEHPARDIDVLRNLSIFGALARETIEFLREPVRGGDRRRRRGLLRAG